MSKSKCNVGITMKKQNKKRDNMQNIGRNKNEYKEGLQTKYREE